jgi:hypothetical protein
MRIGELLSRNSEAGITLTYDRTEDRDNTKLTLVLAPDLIAEIPFSITIPKVEQDARLPEKLNADLADLFAWAVRGCPDWQRNSPLAARLHRRARIRGRDHGYRRGGADALRS